MSTTRISTPKRSPKKSTFTKTGIQVTKSTPNLGASYNLALLQASGASPVLAHFSNNGQGFGLNNPRSKPSRQVSLASLTSNSLAAIPDASKRYPLSTVFDEDMPPAGNMYTPSRVGGGPDELEVGDIVDVPGNMYGTVRFVGSVQGKKGVFAGVELDEMFASKGKNNGDVEGQSVGPGRIQKTRPSIATPTTSRPESPVRRAAAARTSINAPGQRVPSRYGSPAAANFGQNIRGVQDARDPSKKVGYAPTNGMKTPVPPRSVSALGTGSRPAAMNLSDEDTPSAGITRTATNGSVSSISSFNAKLRPASRSASRASRATDDEVERLRGLLEERDREIKAQASIIEDMEKTLSEAQSLMEDNNENAGGHRDSRGSMEDKDAAQLRAIIREKNEKIAMLTAEFDQHRADFRSTIDTLEMAGAETERVYDERMSNLVMELRTMHENSHDVKHVAVQLKQLEELVQELEEGLEDARRGEAEARGEVEFLRGEVERTRSELRREREKTAEALSNANPATGVGAATLSKEIAQRDDEIRGLKAIIHSLSRDAIPDGNFSDHEKTPSVTRPGLHRSRTESASASEEERLSREKLEREVSELRAVVESKDSKEEEMERELEGLRRGSVSNSTTQRTSAISSGTATQDRNSVRDSKGTVGSWRDREGTSDVHHHNLESMPEIDGYSSAAEDFCELCEASGHDVLHCPMFGPNGNSGNSREESPKEQRTGKDVVMEGLKLSPKLAQEEYEPAPLAPAKKSSDDSPIKTIPNLMDPGAAPGKASGVINMDKWCGVCERDGHDSIDCPFEDAF
ncbi:hypothetical protein SS1G_04144 [Sclerotinia sclerotiorum 1980 UF-70]|uniref:CAP-Gly domain-containing protein n=1 Tax=Sclerotinia sclerotiorum (strain ATCC 18683 / 1980 / Ss-1) TaxID=665079 RepID=A7EFQ3_SCLS1|nr:hypothetical protein SS1G_04144 [Sclerotinia sclerotiorum 1980 UF-70]EDO01669.1 hypothetical protein SS1G_04144 [Sclerotinia sclerotiorum 1980 UF-70]